MYSFVTREGLLIMLLSPWLVPTVKKRHTKRPIRTHAAKLGILTRMSIEKTMVRMIMYASGLRSDHRNPSTEFLYLSLKSF